MKAALYRLFLHASEMLEQTDLEDRRNWSTSEYRSVEGNERVRRNTVIAASIAR